MTGGSAPKALTDDHGGIRTISPQDLPGILEIERQCYAHPWSEAVFLDCFRSGYITLGIEEGGKLAGYGILALMFDEAHLLNLCVRPAGRGRGLARALLGKLVRQAAKSGMVRIILEVRAGNRAAKALYEREGFELIGERPGYYPDMRGREDALVMALGLSGPATPVP